MRKRYSKKLVYKKAIRTIVLVAIAIIIGYFISISNFLSPSLDELTASYISFNNTNSTDILKITNISKMPNHKGKSNSNKSYVSFNINGEKNKKYQIILYPIGNTPKEESIYFNIQNSEDNITNRLSVMPSNVDGGKIIYKGIIKEKETTTIKMWLNNDLKEEFENITYEVKIKQ